MKRFEFRLQAVLTLRQRAEQESLEQFAQALRVREAAARRLEMHEAELAAIRKHWLGELSEGCPAVRAAQTLAYSHSLEEQRRQIEKELQQSEAQLDRASQKMLAARQDRESVENLLHRQLADYDTAVRRDEQKFLDDLVGRRTPGLLTDAMPDRVVPG